MLRPRFSAPTRALGRRVFPPRTRSCMSRPTADRCRRMHRDIRPDFPSMYFGAETFNNSVLKRSSGYNHAPGRQYAASPSLDTSRGGPTQLPPRPATTMPVPSSSLRPVAHSSASHSGGTSSCQQIAVFTPRCIVERRPQADLSVPLPLPRSATPPAEATRTAVTGIKPLPFQDFRRSYARLPSRTTITLLVVCLVQMQYTKS